MNYRIDYLDQLEAEAIYILREVYEQFDNSCLMFSGGKDSIVLIHLANKAFYPDKIPFKILHVDTGNNFKEVIKFRDSLMHALDLDLIVASVEKYIKVNKKEDIEFVNRNRLQIPVLLEQIKFNEIDAAIGGGRRDEEKVRAKERIFSHRNRKGQWNPENQRAELWHLYNGKKKAGEHFRIFPLSNWTELDIWNYILREQLEVPRIYFSHKREVLLKDDILISKSEFIDCDGSKIYTKNVRCRTIGDITTTGMWESDAITIAQIIQEISVSSIGERGKRADDKVSVNSMEERKRKGYF